MLKGAGVQTQNWEFLLGNGSKEEKPSVKVSQFSPEAPSTCGFQPLPLGDKLLHVLGGYFLGARSPGLEWAPPDRPGIPDTLFLQ